jgi:bacterioferritin
MKTKFNIQPNVKSKMLATYKDELLIMLKEAIDEEWLTYYQSWIGAILMEGPFKDEVKPELFINANQELNHAMFLKERLLQLGFSNEQTLCLEKRHARCQAPSDYYIESILNNNLESERCAIQRYQQIADFTFEKDQTTYQLISKILDEELSHVHAIEAWLLNIGQLKWDGKIVSIKNKYSVTV